MTFDNQSETIVLGGNVRSTAAAEDARRLALQQVNGNASKVISNIRVDAPTQVQLRVKVAEVKRDAATLMAGWKAGREAAGDLVAGWIQWGALRALVTHSGRGVPEGTYTRLLHGTTVVMSDTPDEIRDHMPFVARARGRVLVHGLGLGMVARALLRNPEVNHVTVVEASPEVLRLVGPHVQPEGPGILFEPAEPAPPRKGRVVLEAPRLRLVFGDAFTWQPPPVERWDAAWHDIWPYISRENLPEMARLHRRFGGKVAYQASWARYECERMR